VILPSWGDAADAAWPMPTNDHRPAAGERERHAIASDGLVDQARDLRTSECGRALHVNRARLAAGPLQQFRRSLGLDIEHEGMVFASRRLNSTVGRRRQVMCIMRVCPVSITSAQYCGLPTKVNLGDGTGGALQNITKTRHAVGRAENRPFVTRAAILKNPYV
jgi:hypothetical protein